MILIDFNQKTFDFSVKFFYMGTMTQYRFNMYNTDYGQDRYCLLYYVNDRFQKDGHLYILTPHIIQFCLRSSEENLLLLDSDFNNSIDPNLTFEKLREKNISSDKLLSWSAAIDLAEQYQIFLDNIS